MIDRDPYRQRRRRKLIGAQFAYERMIEQSPLTIRQATPGDIKPIVGPQLLSLPRTDTGCGEVTIAEIERAVAFEMAWSICRGTEMIGLIGTGGMGLFWTAFRNREERRLRPILTFARTKLPWLTAITRDTPATYISANDRRQRVLLQRLGFRAMDVGGGRLLLHHAARAR